MVTEATKRMLRERLARDLEADTIEHDPMSAYAARETMWEMIDKAAPFMDEGCAPTKWRPSDLIKITYCALASGRTGPGDAALWVLEMLNKARGLWVAGLH